MTLPALTLAQANWTHSSRRWHHHEMKGLRMASAPDVHTVMSIFASMRHRRTDHDAADWSRAAADVASPAASE
jgi:hypothetical protein